MNVEESADDFKFLIRDQDAKFTTGVRRGIRRGGHADHQHSSAGAPGERDRQALDR
jgi:hypothetical protein